MPVSAISPACDEQTETKAKHTPKTIGQFVTERSLQTNSALIALALISSFLL